MKRASLSALQRNRKLSQRNCDCERSFDTKAEEPDASEAAVAGDAIIRSFGLSSCREIAKRTGATSTN